jgi:hypothetical protein
MIESAVRDAINHYLRHYDDAAQDKCNSDGPENPNAKAWAYIVAKTKEALELFTQEQDAKRREEKEIKERRDRLASVRQPRLEVEAQVREWIRKSKEGE